MKEDRCLLEYLLQVALIYVIVVASLINLSWAIGDPDLWKFLLLTFVGFFLPGPAIRRPKPLLSSSASTPSADPFRLAGIGAPRGRDEGDLAIPHRAGCPGSPCDCGVGVAAVGRE